jgi:RNA polymerase sigma-70 factor (ECF subfamily)
MLATIDLVRRVKAGDQSAVDILCKRYLPRLRRWATGRLPRGARGLLDTDDLVLETMVKTLDRLPYFEPRHEAAFQGYVRLAILNRIRDEAVKLRPPRSELTDQARDPGPSPIDEVLGRELMERYEAAFARLKAEDQEAIHMRVELGFSYQQIAEALSKPSVDAARMAVSRGLLRLAREMQDET